MRKAAEFAEAMLDRGFSAENIVEELHRAADAEEFGWTGARSLTVPAGLTDPDPADELSDRVAAVLDADRRATIRKDDVWEVLGY